MAQPFDSSPRRPRREPRHVPVVAVIVRVFPAVVMAVPRELFGRDHPELHAVDAVVGLEEERAVDVRDGLRGVEVGEREARDLRRALLRPVAHPEPAAVGAVVGREEELPVGDREVQGIGELDAVARARVDVRDRGSPRGRPVTPPELLAVRPVGGGEQEHPAHVGQHRPEIVGRADRVAPRIEIRDHGGPGGGPVRGPELAAVGAVVGHEEELVADDRQGRRVGARAAGGVDLLEQDGPGRGPIALPQAHCRRRRRPPRRTGAR